MSENVTQNQRLLVTSSSGIKVGHLNRLVDGETSFVSSFFTTETGKIRCCLKLFVLKQGLQLNVFYFYDVCCICTRIPKPFTLANRRHNSSHRSLCACGNHSSLCKSLASSTFACKWPTDALVQIQRVKSSGIVTGQILATKTPVGHPNWCFSKGIPPKCH